MRSFFRSLFPGRRWFILGGLALLFEASPRLQALPYNALQIEVEPVTATDRLTQGGAAWGDMDGDGDLDLVLSGQDSAGNRQLRVYTNGGAPGYAINATQTEVFGLNNGLRSGEVALGDLNGDGRLDIVVTGNRGGAATRQILVARNNGGLSFSSIPVDAGSGLDGGEPALGDFDNDGDLDLAVSGLDPAGARQFRVYRNNGDATFDPTQIEVPGAAGNGYATRSGVAWGDYNNDGFLDLLVAGLSAGGRRLHLFTNNGNGGFAGPLDVTAGVGGMSDADVAFGDLNNDGLLDVVAMGNSGTNAQLRAYRNNGGPGFTFTAFEAPGAANLGIRNGALAIGDSNNDGVPDFAVVGTRPATGNEEVWLYRNNGGFAFTQFNVESANNLGLQNGGLAWADYNADGSPDLLISGSDSANARQMRVYRNTISTAAAPGAPPTLAGSFAFSPTGYSSATFKWDPAADVAPGATPAVTLTYDLEVSTSSDFSRATIPAMRMTTPRTGNYLRPPRLYDGNTRHGVILRSTQPWAGNNAHPGLRTDTTYYFRVRTMDAGLLPSAPSANQTLWTGVAPGTSTLAAVAGAAPGDINLSWSAPGDDNFYNPLVGAFRVQYSTDAATPWSTATTPAGATTVGIATNTPVGSAQSAVINVPTNDTYYFVLWSRDDVGEWSVVSATAGSAPAPYIRSVTVTAGDPYAFGNLIVGSSSHSATGVTVLNDGNVTSTYSLWVATTTAGSPWSIGTSLPTGPNVAVLSAGFHPFRPAAAAFGAEDVVTGAAALATGAIFTINGSETGVAVPAGQNRSLWFRLDMPTVSDTENQQTLTVTLTANP
ncbi:MAG: VCBS repeat-containing protein [Elusimicrobia bacterium]|nr:VCBS repeat-containing protein [Elusimicrobiota bacterium]MBK8126127.1 VCBS repeat-containing protein [Elusimicrobiota bacterium]MBP8003415.1 VCBS repeat-containing protein [Elusimicrobiota bacterium]